MEEGATEADKKPAKSGTGADIRSKGAVTDNTQNIPVKVLVRIRPHTIPVAHGAPRTIQFTDRSIQADNHNGQSIEYTFDRVFGPSFSTAEIFGTLRPLLVSRSLIRAGQQTGQPAVGRAARVTIMAYGQTGSGKSFTMAGSPDQPGLVPLIVRELLQSDQIRVSFIEIYNERLFDLSDGKERLLREAAGRVVIPGLVERRVADMEQFDKILGDIFTSRRTGETRLNSRSSRSHLLIRVETGGGTVNLVDLAGSENNKKTGNQGRRMEESQSINKSLFVLNKVVSAIVRGDKVIPYRDSKLTRLLQDSLGGAGDCFLIATVVDSHDSSAELLSTLRFAAKAQRITSRAGAERRAADGPRAPTEQHACKAHSGEPTGQPAAGGSRQSGSGSSSSILASRPAAVEMTPVTKQKSLECFIASARSYEQSGSDRQALEIYRTARKFSDSSLVAEAIQRIQNRLKRGRTRFTEFRVLEILNSGDFLETKKLNGVGDKRARDIVNFILGGHFFESIGDLRMLFSASVVSAIRESVESD